MGTLHGPNLFGADGPTANGYATNLSTGFHKYGLLWLPNKIVWTLDGKVYSTMTPSSSGFGSDWVFNQKFFLIMNLAMGGNLGGELDPGVTQADYLIDYVKYYKVKVGKKYYGTLYKS